MSVGVCCIQMGARLHYGTAQAFAEAGMLRALVTDVNNRIWKGSVPAALAKVAPRSLRRAIARDVPKGIDNSLVHSMIRPTAESIFVSKFRKDRSKDARWVHANGLASHRLSQLAIRHDMFGADSLYVYPCEATDVMRFARERSRKIFYESIAHPYDSLIENLEAEKFGTPLVLDPEVAQSNIDFFKEEIEIAHVVIAASRYTRSGLIELGVPETKIEIVPYGLDIGNWCHGQETEVGRILFVGTVGHRKGALYYAEMARKFSVYPCYSFHSIGPVDPRLSGLGALNGPIYHGQVPRSEVREHFSRADVFAFPTLSDGFGLTILEAMACGLPVVCTPNCADLVEDGVNGFVTPARNAEAMGRRIRQIVEDRSLRETMSRAARSTAEYHSMAAYGDRLRQCVSDRMK